MNQNRKYGVELEVEGIGVDQARQVLAPLSVPTNTRDDNQGDFSKWSVHYDGSLDSGAEIVSRILTGDQGKAEIAVVAPALRAAGATVGPNCGLHVHVDVSDFTLPMLRTLVHRYAHFESKIDRIVSGNRRGNRNSFSHSMHAFISAYDEEMKVPNRTPRDFAGRIDSRYYKLNLVSIYKYGTVEFRQHQGSIDPVKINAWVEFVVNFVEETKAYHQRVFAAGAEQRADVKQESRDKMFELLCMFIAAGTSGVDRQRIQDKLGWSATTVPVMVSQLRSKYGVTVKKSRLRGEWRIVYRNSARAEVAHAERVVRTVGMMNVLDVATPLALDVIANSRSGVVAQPARSMGQPLMFSGDDHYRGLPVELTGWFKEREFELNAG